MEMDISISTVIIKVVISEIISQDSLSCKWLKLRSNKRMQKQEFVGSRNWEVGVGGGSNSWLRISDVATELLHALHLYSPLLSVLVSTVFFCSFFKYPSWGF